MVRRDGVRVRCYTCNGYDWADRFPAIVEAASPLKAQIAPFGGEAVICQDDGLSDTRCAADAATMMQCRLRST